MFFTVVAHDGGAGFQGWNIELTLKRFTQRVDATHEQGACLDGFREDVPILRCGI